MPGPLDGPPDHRGSSEAEVSAASRSRNHSSSPPKPRPQAVAGKKCGAWRTSPTITWKRWRRCSVYERPYNPAEPVVCLDEKPVTLHDDVRPARPMAPG